MRKNQTTRWGVGMLVAGMLAAQGCATRIAKPAQAPQPAKERLGTFTAVEMKSAVIAAPFDAAAANKKATKKINEELFAQMRQVFPNLKEKGDGEVATAGKTLVIEPTVEEIKFIGGFARFMVGAMAGSSAVRMKVVFKNAATGEVIADPQFYRAAGAFTGAHSMGVADNLMLSEIARDICSYASLNR